MTLVTRYLNSLCKAYARTKNLFRTRRLTREDKRTLAKVLYESKRLCLLVEKQRRRGQKTGSFSRWPVDPYAAVDPEQPLVYTLENYSHMAPEIKRFMDRAAVEYTKVFDKNPPVKRWWNVFV